MIEKIITACLLVIAVIHLAPITGVAGVANLKALYGIDVTGGDLEILMRHRAVLFGILGVFFAYAAFKPELQVMAFIAAFATLVPLLYLAFSVGFTNVAIQKVVVADVVAIISLAIAVGCFYFKGGR